MRPLQLTTSISLAALVALAGAGVLAVIYLYARERKAVSRPVGWAATLLRALLVLAVVFMLAEPVWRYARSQELPTYIAVLVDRSASMQFVDRQMSAATQPSQDAQEPPPPMSRLQRAQELLTRPISSGKTLLEALSEKNRVKLYAFDSQATAVEAAHLSDSAATRPAGSAMQTNLSAALHLAASDLSGQHVAGVVVLSDGRINSAGGEADADMPSGLSAPVFPVLIGSEKPPRDAALLAVQAPSAVLLHDKLEVAAEVKLTGVSGQPVHVELLRDGQVRDSLDVVPRQESVRRQCLLKDLPNKPGVAHYQLRIEPVEGEAILDNNVRDLLVNVADDHVNVLMVEGRPRWEYRYLKNLFAEGDAAVRLHHVLLEPVELAGRPKYRPLPAEAANQEPQADALPASPQEWMKFDVIILGDVVPECLDAAAMQTLEQFVADRGGTLIVIAGTSAMPQAYGSPLSDMLPVTVKPGLSGLSEPFRLALTSEGRQEPFMRLSDAAQSGEGAWGNLPPLYWRSAVVQAKPTARVYAYAAPGGAEASSMPSAASSPAVPGDAAGLREYAARRALMASGSYGLGKVLFLGFDETWRLRFRIGDQFHHRFWSQVLRWAAPASPLAGSAEAKIGTDRLSYPENVRPTVRVQLLNQGAEPNLDEAVFVELSSSQDSPASQPASAPTTSSVLLRQKLSPAQGSRGLYEAQLPPLLGGTYRVVLSQPDLKGEAGAPLTSEFIVESGSPQELADLSADAAQLANLAGQTGGKLLRPGEIAQLPSLLTDKPPIVREPAEEPLWSHGYLLAAIMLLASAEWMIRKRSALP